MRQPVVHDAHVRPGIDQGPNLTRGRHRSAGSVTAGARNASVIHMTKTLSIELAKYGINVNAVYPATTVTETFVNQFHIQATGGAQSFLVTELFHITVTPDFNVRVIFGNFSSTC